MSQVTDTPALNVSAEKSNIQLLVFAIHGEEFACNLTDVREIINTPPLTPVPNVSQMVSGVTNLRGRVATVIDMERLFGFEHTETKKEHMIVAEQGNEVLGLLVDNVKEVLRSSGKFVQHTPEMLSTTEAAKYVQTVFVIDQDEKNDKGRIILILDTAAIMTRFTQAK